MLQRFIGIGAQKCASSWLHDILADHPEVAVPATKELDFFSYRYELGYRWYKAQFPARTGTRSAGEASPSYFHEPAAVIRAKAFDPTLRIVVSLRDPVDRALSQHRHLARLGLLPKEDLSFEAALASNPTYEEQGRYHTHLSRWLEAFGQERVQVLLMEDIQQDPGSVAARLYRFLGISDTHVSAALGRPSNISYLPRSRTLDASVRAIRGTIVRLGLAGVWSRAGDAGLRQVYRTLNRRRAQDLLPAPRPETIAMLRERFVPEVERLQVLIQRDLSSWVSGKPTK